MRHEFPSMQCKEASGLLAEFALEELSRSEQQELENHLGHCESCAQELVEIRDALGLMEAWQAEEPGAQLTTRTRRALEAERTGPMSLEERYHNFLHWLVHLEITPIRGVLATALGVCLFVVLHNFGDRPVVSASSTSGCQKNLSTLKTATVRYSQAHEGKFPEKLEVLYPDFIGEYPFCPSAGYDTYSEGFGVDPEPDEFVIYCSGQHHAEEGLGPNEPRVSWSKSELPDER
jgi:Putative zinc-finger